MFKYIALKEIDDKNLSLNSIIISMQKKLALKSISILFHESRGAENV